MKKIMTHSPRLKAVGLYQQGLSLVELMVSLVVGLILIYGVSEIYVNSKGTYNVNEEMSRMQENARFAFDLMVPTVRVAGYTGCAAINAQPYDPLKPNDLRKGITGTGDEFSGATAVKGNDFDATGSTWIPALSLGLSGTTIRNNTDAITIKSTDDCGGQLVQIHKSTTAQVQISATNTCGFVAGDSMMISDCSQWNLFTATTVANGTVKTNISHGNNANNQPHLTYIYKEDAQLLRFQDFSYYIGDGAAANMPALRRLNNGSGADDELVEGVESMQILYGVDTDATADGVVNRYVKANAIPVGGHDWDRVVAVRISLLMRSVGAAATASGSYVFDGVTYGADRLLRQEYTTTVQLRNRSVVP